MNTLQCSMCQLDKPTTEFFSNKKRKTGFDCYCKSCRRDYSRKHYKMQTEYYTNKRDRRRSKTKQYIINLKKNSKCFRCGFSNPAALDFHHRNPADKEFAISSAWPSGVGLTKLKLEIDKCDILCANCHRIEHADLDQW